MMALGRKFYKEVMPRDKQATAYSEYLAINEACHLLSNFGKNEGAVR